MGIDKAAQEPGCRGLGGAALASESKDRIRTAGPQGRQEPANDELKIVDGAPALVAEIEIELAVFLGWDNARMARIYTRKAAQKKLALSAAAKMASGAAKERTRVPLTVPPDRGLCKPIS